MLMDSSQLSRVCGHGHIKKFWLLQTQKESTTTCENRIIGDDVRKSPLSPSELSSHTELSRRSSQSYGDNAGTTERKDFASAFSSEDDDDDDEGELGTVENALNLNKKKKKKSSIEVGAHIVPSNISASSSSSSSSCDFGSSLRSSYCSNVASEVEEENKCCVSVTRDGFGCSASSPMEEEEEAEEAEEAEEEEEEEERTLGIGYVNDHFHQDSLISPCGRSNNANETLCSSPTSLMEVECEEEPENLDSKKLSPRLAIRVDNEVNGNSELATQVSESDEVGLITHQASKFDLLPEFSDFAKALEVARVSKNAASLQESRNRSPNKSFVQLNTSLIKECALCGATKTPMWRSGPQGPKSLCNACGIRYKKYRSYPSQSDVIMSDTMVKPPKWSSERSLKQQRKRKWHHHLGSTPLKSICGYPFPSRLKKRLSNIDIEHQSVRRVFAEDEEEAAVLLMHLSCGLVY